MSNWIFSKSSSSYDGKDHLKTFSIFIDETSYETSNGFLVAR